MNVNYKWGIYNEGGLVNISAGLNITPTYYFELKKLLHVRRIKGFPMVRVGAKTGDGGYVMVKDFVDSGIAYSFGISGDVSWDKDMAERGYDVYMYDHTITSLPEENEKFHFFQEGIGFEFDPYGPLDTLSSYIARNNHSATKNMILKIDTEGAEWDFFKAIDATILDQFDQIVFEVHNLVKSCTEDEMERKLEAFRLMSKTFDLVHLHGNNCGCVLEIGNSIFPDALELTYVNKNKYETTEHSYLSLPTVLDSANDLGRSDIQLGDWNTPLIFDT